MLVALQAFLVGRHILLPELSFLDIRRAEFPVLFRLIDALDESFSLFVLREMEKKLDDACSIGVEVLFQIDDGTVPVMPEHVLVERLVGDAFAAENLRMDPNNQNILVI